MEEWRPAPGFEDLYEVSNTGKVRSITRVIHKSEEWMARNHKTLHREFDSVYKSKELKPCATTKRGVKYHLHRRFKDGYYNQASYYVYAEDLVKGAFPELDEEWKAIPGYEDYYEVSNTGRVRSLDRYESFKINGIVVTRFRQGKELRPLKVSKDPVVNLAKDGLFISMKLSRLVAEAFVANPNNYSCINHKDFDRTNNSANNLVWVPYHTRSNISNDVTEEWRNIPGYENIYEVSNTGKVRSVARQVPRKRSRNDISFEDCPEYESRELKPCRFNKKSGIAVYHLHERYKAGRYGQTDVYYRAEDLIQLAFPELYEKEN